MLKYIIFEGEISFNKQSDEVSSFAVGCDMYDQPISCIVGTSSIINKCRELLYNNDIEIMDCKLTSNDADAKELLINYRADQIYNEVGYVEIEY